MEEWGRMVYASFLYAVFGEAEFVFVECMPENILVR